MRGRREGEEGGGLWDYENLGSGFSAVGIHGAQCARAGELRYLYGYVRCVFYLSISA